MDSQESRSVLDTDIAGMHRDVTITSRRHFLKSMAAALAIGPALLQAEDKSPEEDEKKAALVVTVIAKHMNAAFEHGQFIVDAKKERAREDIDLQRDQVLVAIFKELSEKGIEFSGSDSVQKLSAFLRSNGYLYIDGNITTDLPDNRGTYVAFIPTLHKIRRSRRQRIDGYMKTYLQFQPGSDAEILYVGESLIESYGKAIMKKYGMEYHILGTTERREGGAAVIFEDNIRRKAKEAAKKHGKPFEKVLEEYTADVEANEIFHLIFRKIFRDYIDSKKFKSASFSQNGKKFSPHDVDEAFSDLGTVLYGKTPFVDLVNQHTNNKASQTYELSNLLSREVAESTAQKLGIAFEKDESIDIPAEQLEQFEKEFKNDITKSIMGMMFGLLRSLQREPRAEEKREK